MYVTFVINSKTDKYKKEYLEESVKNKIYDLNPQINGLPICLVSAKKLEFRHYLN